jgi:hypothetical protein
MRLLARSFASVLLVALVGCSEDSATGDAQAGADSQLDDSSEGSGEPDVLGDSGATDEGGADGQPDAEEGGEALTDAGADVSDTEELEDVADSTGSLDAAGDDGGELDAAEDVVSEDVSTDPPIPEPDVEPLFANCSPPDGPRNIYDIQDPQCPDHFSPEPTGQPGVWVELSGVVVTAVFGDTFFVQEPAGGPYSGLAVFAHGEPLSALVPGLIVNVSGYYAEFYGSTQIYLEEFTIEGQTEEPEPYEVLHPSHVATDGPIAEMFEGVLVRVRDVVCVHTKPDCPNDWGEFMVTGDLRVDDMGVDWDARLGDSFQAVTGPLHYTFSNHKIEPRTEEDLVLVEKGGSTALSKCTSATCSVMEDNPGSQEIVISEVMPDPFGNDTGQEWIEFHNPGDEPVDMYGWQIRDCGDQKWTLTAKDLVVQPGGYLVIGVNSDPLTNGGVPVDVAYGQAFYMPNTVGSVLLFKGASPQAALVDQARFTAFEEWSEILVPGHSIERVDFESSGAYPAAWKMGTKPFGPTGKNFGTPGAKNSAK